MYPSYGAKLQRQSPRVGQKTRYQPKYGLSKEQSSPARIEHKEMRAQFFQAAKEGKRSQLSKILKTAAFEGPDTINARDHSTAEGNTALHLAVIEGRIKTCEFLLKAGAGVDIKTEQAKESSLHLACRLALKTIMTILLQNGADPNCQDSKGQTPLHILAKYVDSKEMAKCFFDSTIHPVDISILDHNMKKAETLAKSREVKFLFKQVKGQQSSDAKMNTSVGALNKTSKVSRQFDFGIQKHGIRMSSAQKRDKPKQFGTKNLNPRKVARVVNLDSSRSTSIRSNESSISTSSREKFKKSQALDSQIKFRKVNQPVPTTLDAQPSKVDVVVHNTRKESVQRMFAKPKFQAKKQSTGTLGKGRRSNTGTGATRIKKMMEREQKAQKEAAAGTNVPSLQIKLDPKNRSPDVKSSKKSAEKE